MFPQLYVNWRRLKYLIAVSFIGYIFFTSRSCFLLVPGRQLKQRVSGFEKPHLEHGTTRNSKQLFFLDYLVILFKLAKVKMIVSSRRIAETRNTFLPARKFEQKRGK